MCKTDLFQTARVPRFGMMTERVSKPNGKRPARSPENQKEIARKQNGRLKIKNPKKFLAKKKAAEAKKREAELEATRLRVLAVLEKRRRLNQ